MRFSVRLNEPDFRKLLKIERDDEPHIVAMVARLDCCKLTTEVPTAMIASRGKLLLGARPLAQHIFDDEEKFRSVYNEDLQRELGLFMLGKRVAGYTGVIDARLNAKIVGKPDPASRPKA
jgi:hypothetical protein